MLTRSRTTRDLFPRVARRAAALAVLLALFASAAPLAPEAHAQKKNGRRHTVGTLEVSTSPGGNPLFIDDAPAGPTTESMRVIELTPGPHKIEIVFPNGTRWSHVVNTIAGRKDCVRLNYQPREIKIAELIPSPCPYPVNVSAPATADDGSMITFSADVAYTGQSALNYTWTVSPPTATITSGAGTPTITVDSTGSGRRVTAILVVDDGSGDRACRQTAQASTAITPRIPPPDDSTHDDFVSVAPDDDKARLDLLAIKMQEQPTYRAYVIAYGGCGRGDKSPEVLLERAYTYLVRDRQMDASRITKINGGYRERNGFELWVQSPGKSDPVARPTRGPCNARR